MMRVVMFLALSAVLASSGLCAQNQRAPQNPPASQAAPRSDASQTEANQDADSSGRADDFSSSSKATPVDLTPPPDDAKTHPNSEEAVHEMEDAAGLMEGDEIGGIEEFHPWDPHKAEKDIEVGDFYFKRQNYRAALDRYQEALYFKNNDAVATFKLATCQEKLGESEDARKSSTEARQFFDDARKSYDAYLKLLPEGPFAAEAHKALDRLGGASGDKVPNPDRKPELSKRPVSQ